MKSKLLVLFVIVGLLCAFLPSTSYAADHRYLGSSVDRCNNGKVLTLWDARGYAVNLDGDDSAWVYVGQSRFAWWCGGSEEWTTGPMYTRWVHVVREPHRKISWGFFS